jgi:glycosyltransferase involved in cell wall biosynthesis
VTALGINYLGDPHNAPYLIYPCHDYYGGDPFGTYRLPKLCKKLNPDVVIIQQDPWNFPSYFSALKKAEVTVPVIGSVAVDGKNCRGRAMRDLQHAAFWTEFGRDEAVKGGYEGPTSVIPLGVDTSIYHPLDKVTARKYAGLTGKYADAFIVGNINRNQPRKRLDLTIANFAEWVKTYNIPDAYLLMHVAPTGDRGYDVDQLMSYYGVFDRLLLSKPDIGLGVTEDALCSVYNSFDVQVSTTQGEGWGLTTMEGMACGIPQIVPDWSGLGEWTEDAAIKIPCVRENIVTPDEINSIGGVVSSVDFIEALHRVYSDRDFRLDYGERGFHLVREKRFQWDTIANQWLTLVTDFLETQRNPVSVAVGA